MSKNGPLDKEVFPPDSREAQIRKVRRQERLLKMGLAFIAVAMVAVVSLFVYNYISARSGRPKSFYESQLSQLKFWQDTVKKNPKSSPAHTNLGFIYLQIGREGRAIAEFKKALKYDPKNADAFLHLGRVYLKRGQEERALSLLKKSVKYAPEKGRYLAYFLLGEIYEDKKDYDRALDYYKKSVSDEPLTWNAHFKLGQFYERQGKKDLALEEYKTAETFNPRNQQIKEAIKRLSQ